MKELKELTQSVGESVGTYAQNFKLMLKEMSAEVRPSEYHQMIKFKKGLRIHLSFLLSSKIV